LNCPQEEDPVNSFGAFMFSVSGEITFSDLLRGDPNKKALIGYLPEGIVKYEGKKVKR
jgi:hypothetical protein